MHPTFRNTITTVPSKHSSRPVDASNTNVNALPITPIGSGDVKPPSRDQPPPKAPAPQAGGRADDGDRVDDDVPPEFEQVIEEGLALENGTDGGADNEQDDGNDTDDSYSDDNRA